MCHDANRPKLRNGSLGPTDDEPLAAARLAAATLGDVIAGLRTLDAELEATGISAELVAQRTIADEVDRCLLE